MGVTQDNESLRVQCLCSIVTVLFFECGYGRNIVGHGKARLIKSANVSCERTPTLTNIVPNYFLKSDNYAYWNVQGAVAAKLLYSS